MKILAARVEWMMPYANDPLLYILVDRWPREDEFVYDVYDGEQVAKVASTLAKSADRRIHQVGSRPFVTGLLYYAEQDGAVSFFARGQDKRGYSGRTFNLRMRDGTTLSLTGPYSSSPDTMAAAGFPWSFYVAYVENRKDWEGGFGFVGGHLTVAMAEEAAVLAGVTIEGPAASAPIYPPGTPELSYEQDSAHIVGEKPVRWRVAGKYPRYTQVIVDGEKNVSRITGKASDGLLLLERNGDWQEREWIKQLDDGRYVAVRQADSGLGPVLTPPFRLEVVGGVWPIKATKK